MLWYALGIQNLDALAWLNLHKNGWGYDELIHENCMKEVKHLMLRSSRIEDGRVQIDYLTEDLKIDPTHNVGNFLRLLRWFSEAKLL